MLFRSPGPFGRTVEDSALMLQAMAGHDPKDSTSAPLALPDFVAAARNPDIKGMKVGIPKEYRVDGTSPEIVSLLQDAVTEVRGTPSEFSTGGGTSDARFIKNYCPVLEFGLIGQTMHAVDERISVSDLEGLTGIYTRMIERYFRA